MDYDKFGLYKVLGAFSASSYSKEAIEKEAIKKISSISRMPIKNTLYDI